MTSPPMPTSQQTKEDTDEVHDLLERTFARIAHRVRECPEADSGGLYSMESARQLQDRDVRHTSGGLGRVYAAGLRRSVGGSQVLLDAACLCIRSAASGSCLGRRPGRA